MLKRKKGVSLLELSILLVVSGLIAGFGVNLLNTYFENKKADLNAIRIQDVDNALRAFYDFHDYLPCPAKLDISYDDPDAGKAQNCSTLSKSYSINGQDVIVGAVPFQALGLDKNYYANLWDNKYLYVIPRKLAQSETRFLEFEDIESNALFNIKNTHNKMVIDEKIAYLIVDHGKNNNGVYKKNSDTQKNCTIDNCEFDRNFNFLPTKKTNLMWKNYYDLLIANGSKPEPKTSNIIVDEIWMDENNPPTSNGVFLLTNPRKYRKLDGNRIKDYSVVQVITDVQTGKAKYNVINYAKQDSIITKVGDGSFALTKHGMQYVGNDYRKFNVKTFEIQDFVNSLPTSSDPDGIYVLNKVEPSHQIEGLESSNAVQILIKNIDGQNFFVSDALNNQTVFNLQTGDLKRYHKPSLQWLDLDKKPDPVFITDSDNYCGGRVCRVPGVRKCGPLMPGETDRDIYGRFVVRDFLLGPAITEINPSNVKNIWPDPSNIDHSGLYFSHYELSDYFRRTDPRHPSKHKSSSFNSSAQKFLAKLENNTWYKYQNRDLGVVEEQDIYNLVTNYNSRAFEFCKEGVGVFSIYTGIGFAYDSLLSDAQNPILAVLDDELKLDEYNNINKTCCDDLEDDKSYLIKFESHVDDGDSNISCFQKNNFFLYYKNEAIGQLNPLFGVFSNEKLNFTVQEDKVNGGVNSGYKGKISFSTNVSQSEDRKSFKDLIDKNGKYTDIIDHLKTNSVVSGDEQRIFTLNNELEDRIINLSNGCKLTLKQKVKRKVRINNKEIGGKNFQMINHVNHFYNFFHAPKAEDIIENKLYGFLNENGNNHFSYCFQHGSPQWPYFLQLFFPQISNLGCESVISTHSRINMYNNSMSDKKSKINFGNIYYVQ